MPRFSLRDLFWATTLIAVGLTTIVAMLKMRIGTDIEAQWAAWLAAASCVAIGVGIGVPFQRKILGAVIGMVVASLLAVGAVMLLYSRGGI